METSILNAIGNTPVVQISRSIKQPSAKVFMKLEFFNPTGSYKDRMAKSMIESALKSGKLQR